jgi:hypothetical protein
VSSRLKATQVSMDTHGLADKTLQEVIVELSDKIFGLTEAYKTLHKRIQELEKVPISRNAIVIGGKKDE